MKSWAIATLAVFAASRETPGVAVVSVAGVTVVARPYAELLLRARGLVNERLEKKRSDFSACTEKKLPFVAASEQQIDFSVDVRDDGSVGLASVTMSTLGQSAIENCLLAVMRTLRFDFGRGQLRVSLPVAVNMPLRNDAVPTAEVKLTGHGTLSAPQAQESVDRASFFGCQDKHPKNYAAQLKLQVEAQGTVSHAEVLTDTGVTRDGNIDNCLVDVAKRLRFASIEHGAGSTVYVPIVFSDSTALETSRPHSKRSDGCSATR